MEKKKKKRGEKKEKAQEKQQCRSLWCFGPTPPPRHTHTKKKKKKNEITVGEGHLCFKKKKNKKRRRKKLTRTSSSAFCVVCAAPGAPAALHFHSLQQQCRQATHDPTRPAASPSPDSPPCPTATATARSSSRCCPPYSPVALAHSVHSCADMQASTAAAAAAGRRSVSWTGLQRLAHAAAPSWRGCSRRYSSKCSSACTCSCRRRRRLADGSRRGSHFQATVDGHSPQTGPPARPPPPRVWAAATT